MWANWTNVGAILLILVGLTAVQVAGASWSESIGYVGVTDWAGDLALTAAGGCVIAGGTAYPGYDGLIVRLSDAGGVLWQKEYRGNKEECFEAVCQATDGGYLAVGARGSQSPGGKDLWCVKIGPKGRIKWQRSYGGSGDDFAEDVIATADGDYVVVGSTNSFGAGGQDAWCMKLDGSGNIIWQEAIGGAATDAAYSVVAATDGGYLVGANRDGKLWLIKLDALGSVVWEKVYGSDTASHPASVARTSDGGYAVGTAGINPPSLFPAKALLLKLDAAGGITWQKHFDEDSPFYSPFPSVNSIIETADGGFVLGGEIGYSGVSVSFDVGFYRRTDESGNLLWERSFSGSRGVEVHSIYAVQEVTGGDLLAAGYSTATGRPGDPLVFRVPADGGFEGGCTHFGTGSATIADHAATASTVSSVVTLTSAAGATTKERAAIADLRTKQLCD